MRLIPMAAMAAVTLHAAAVRGIVLDYQTGRPLARATVVAQPLEGTAAVPRSAVSNLDGVFEVSGLAAGPWLVITSRRGFAPTRSVATAADTAPPLTVRLRRFGVITGAVLDENEVGLQDHDVLAYRDARPLVIVARARTDDRGVYRFDGLEPGSYLVRTVGGDYDEGRYLPTFAREVLRLDQTRPVAVHYDEEVGHVDLRPLPGRLFVVQGRVYGATRAVVSLVSDVGVQTASTDANGIFRFPPTHPGRYEIHTQVRDQAAWRAFELYEGSGNDIRLSLAPCPELQLALEDTNGKPVDPALVPLLLRRRDLSGLGNPELFGGQPRLLVPGRWELMLPPTPSWYLVGPPGWTEVVVTAPGAVAKLVLSNRPATVRGVVRDASGEPVAGAPVHLSDVRSVRTDAKGRFEFYGLAPGGYQLFAAFDSPPVATHSKPVTLDEGQDRTIDLDLYIPK